MGISAARMTQFRNSLAYTLHIPRKYLTHIYNGALAKEYDGSSSDGCSLSLWSSFAYPGKLLYKTPSSAAILDTLAIVTALESRLFRR